MGELENVLKSGDSFGFMMRNSENKIRFECILRTPIMPRNL